MFNQIINRSQYNAGFMSDNILFVSSSMFARRNQYRTIAAAKAAWSAGKIILLAPETFTENVSLDDDEIVIQGTSKSHTIINGTAGITGKNCVLENLTVAGNFSVNCPDDFDLMGTQKNKIIDCILQSNISIGTPEVQNVFGFTFENCLFTGDNTDLVLNSAGEWMNHSVFNNCRTPDFTGLPNYHGYNLKVYGGYNSFWQCPYLLFNSILMDSQVNFTLIEFYHCSYLIVGAGGFTVINNTVNYAVFAAFQTDIAIAAVPLTFSNLFEFDIGWGRLNMPNIVFNSIANSRFQGVMQVGYNSPSVLSGTGMNKLRISHSVFHFAAPAGLAEDNFNAWSAFIDD